MTETPVLGVNTSTVTCVGAKGGRCSANCVQGFVAVLGGEMMTSLLSSCLSMGVGGGAFSLQRLTVPAPVHPPPPTTYTALPVSLGGGGGAEPRVQLQLVCCIMRSLCSSALWKLLRRGISSRGGGFLSQNALQTGRGGGPANRVFGVGSADASAYAASRRDRSMRRFQLPW